MKSLQDSHSHQAWFGVLVGAKDLESIHGELAAKKQELNIVDGYRNWAYTLASTTCV